MILVSCPAMDIAKALAVVLLVLLLTSFTHAQSNDRVQQTWKGPDVSDLWELLQDAGAKDARVDVLKFTPAGDSGVTKALADAIGGTPEERASLAQAFAQLKQGYEAEVAREGKSNNLAAAMTFFIAANVITYHQTEMPSDADIAKLMESMQQAMAKIPHLRRCLVESCTRSLPLGSHASACFEFLLGDGEHSSRHCPTVVG